jgi:hypothetical protein
LIVFDTHTEDGAADPRRYRADVTVDLRVVDPTLFDKTGQPISMEDRRANYFPWASASI